MTRRHFSTRGGAQVKIAARSPMSTAAATRRSPSSGVCEGKFQRECDQTFGCRTRSPMLPTGATRWPPCRGQGGMGVSKLEVVARDGPIREANQDRRAKRVCPKGENWLKPIRVNPTNHTRGFSTSERPRWKNQRGRSLPPCRVSLSWAAACGIRTDGRTR